MGSPSPHKASGLPHLKDTAMYNEEDILYEEVDSRFLKDVVYDMARSIAQGEGYHEEKCIYIIDDPRLTDESTLILTLELVGSELELSYEYDNRRNVADFPAFDNTDFGRILYDAECDIEQSARDARDIAETEYWLNMTYR